MDEMVKNDSVGYLSDGEENSVTAFTDMLLRNKAISYMGFG